MLRVIEIESISSLLRAGASLALSNGVNSNLHGPWRSCQEEIRKALKNFSTLS